MNVTGRRGPLVEIPPPHIGTRGSALKRSNLGPGGQGSKRAAYPHDVPRIEVVAHGQPWSFDGDGHQFRLVSEAHRIRLPDKRELDLGKPLALDFARQFLPDDFDEVRQFFNRRGAYLRQIQGTVGLKGRARSMVRFRGESRGKNLEDVVQA